MSVSRISYAISTNLKRQNIPQIYIPKYFIFFAVCAFRRYFVYTVSVFWLVTQMPYFVFVIHTYHVILLHIIIHILLVFGFINRKS